jgi:ATP-binding cassette subfamily C (CFTR/MRP) protein 1
MVAGLITVICGLAVGLRSKVDPGFLGLALVSAVRAVVPVSTLSTTAY